ncbi:MAG TPA: PIN domain-containing protein [Chloroflexota bacterium]|nr:PIN domain-containing protein [Chloroflexota bacterium]
MTPPYVDTNVLIRYITRDEPQQGQRAALLMDQFELGTATATTCEAVFVEAVQVLSSWALYNLPRQDIAAYLTRFVRLKGVKLPSKRLYIRALSLYGSTNLDFPDALIVAHVERTRAPSVYSFDRDFDRIPGITRQEP